MTPRDIVCLRKRLGFNQPRLARFIEINQVTICRWETGHSKPAGLSLVVLRALHEAVSTDAGLRRILKFRDLAELIEAAGLL